MAIKLFDYIMVKLLWLICCKQSGWIQSEKAFILRDHPVNVTKASKFWENRVVIHPFSWILAPPRLCAGRDSLRKNLVDPDGSTSCRLTRSPILRLSGSVNSMVEKEDYNTQFFHNIAKNTSYSSFFITQEN